jgi:hypothetical protein
MIGVGHARVEVVGTILRIVVSLGIFEPLYEASMVIANVKLLASFKLLLTTRVIILVDDIHPLFALTTTPRCSVAFLGGLALVGH